MDCRLDENEIKEAMKMPLSNFDIFNIAGKVCNMFVYEQLEDIESIPCLFENNHVFDCVIGDSLPYTPNSCLLLYRTNENMGHWCVLNRSKGRYDFLDSYGDVPDDQLEHIDEDFRFQSNQIRRHLTNLLDNARNTIHYNSKQLQEYSTDVSTCGRYAAMFIKYNGLPVEKFCKMIANDAKKLNMNTDEYVTVFTSSCCV